MRSEHIQINKTAHLTSVRMQKALFAAGIALALVFALFFGHGDMYLVTTWSVSFCRSLLEGTISSFPQQLAQMGLETNYSLFSVAFWGVLFLPLSLLEKHTSFPVLLNDYFLLLKGALLLFSVGCACLIRKIVCLLNGPDERLHPALLYVLSCPLLMVSALGRGQTDLAGLFFILLSLCALLQERYIAMSCWMGVSLLFKPFGFFFLLPWLCLLFARKKGRMLICGLICAGFYLGERVLTRLLYPAYYVLARDMELRWGYDFFGDLLSARLGQVSLLPLAAILVLFFCLLTGWKRAPKPLDFLMAPMLLFGFFILFVPWHTNYLVYALPALAVLAAVYASEQEAFLCFFAFNCGLMVYDITGFYSTAVGDDGVVNIYRYSPLVRLLPEKQVLRLYDLLNGLSAQMPAIGKTLAVGAFWLLLASVWLTRRRIRSGSVLTQNEGDAPSVRVPAVPFAAFWLLYLPAAGFAAATFLLYLMS